MANLQPPHRHGGWEVVWCIEGFGSKGCLISFGSSLFDLPVWFLTLLKGSIRLYSWSLTWKVIHFVWCSRLFFRPPHIVPQNAKHQSSAHIPQNTGDLPPGGSAEAHHGPRESRLIRYGRGAGSTAHCLHPPASLKHWLLKILKWQGKSIIAMSISEYPSGGFDSEHLAHQTGYRKTNRKTCLTQSKHASSPGTHSPSFQESAARLWARNPSRACANALPQKSPLQLPPASA